MAFGWFTYRQFLVSLCWGVMSLAANELSAAIRVSPAAVMLNRPEGSQQLLVTETLPDGRSRDATRAARYEISAASVATVDSAGLVRPLAEGVAEIIIRHGVDEVRVPTTVRGLGMLPPVSFQYDVIPPSSPRPAAIRADATAKRKGRTASS
jgi:hypothetical protein